MKMNCLMYILLIYVISCNYLVAQDSFESKIKVDYDITLLLNSLQEYKGTLLFNNNQSYFFYKNKSNKTIKETSQKIEGFNVKQNITKIDTTTKRVLINKSDNLILFSAKENTIIKEDIYIKEFIPKIKWNITNEQKKIGSILCKKAETKYRGRNYIAWFAPEIPTFFGPLKYGQLPGLILKISDDQNKIIISASNISYPIKETVNLPRMEEIIAKEKYDSILQEKIILFKKQKTKQLKKLISKMDRTAKMTEIDIKIELNQLNTIELKEDNN